MIIVCPCGAILMVGGVYHKPAENAEGKSCGGSFVCHQCNRTLTLTAYDNKNPGHWDKPIDPQVKPT